MLGGPKGLAKSSVLDEQVLTGYTLGQWAQIAVADDKVMADVEALKLSFEDSIARLEQRFENKVDKVQRGDDLPPGVMKMVKVFVAVKRKLQPGDKMAGRHGNKGVISKIVPVEDMPYVEDGTPVDIVLNPLGVPSRMNVGQILETHLGWACAGLGKQVSALLDAVKSNSETEALREKLKDIYGDQEYETEIGAAERRPANGAGENLRARHPDSLARVRRRARRPTS